ncbi:MAG: hypothetical protein E7311_01025 [Clostridiales bacterium]|nr:hypothetical protein [Clostridiales bacterium]
MENKANTISTMQKNFKEHKETLITEISSLEKSLAKAFQTITGNFNFIQEILEEYEDSIDDFADSKLSTEKTFKWRIDKYMDLSRYSNAFKEIIQNKRKMYFYDADVKKLNSEYELQKAISAWINKNLSYLNEYISGYTFYLKEAHIDKYYYPFKKLHVYVTFTIDVKKEI